ncbi:MAG: FAD-dependent oxidoreductase, partial [Quisquiliibacterium sp.]
MTKVAVVGAGISGLAAALRLTPHAEVTLYEAANYLGGHSNTVEVSLDGCRYPVDTGFLVFNHRTYPGLVRLFEELSVPTAASDMSFSVSIGPHQFEWCGTNLAALFAQPSNALSPRFWRMLRDLFRFNRQASEMARQFEAQPQSATLNQPIGEFLANQRYSDAFKDLYLLPMAAAIWSCPMETMLYFPLDSFVRFLLHVGVLLFVKRRQ